MEDFPSNSHVGREAERSQPVGEKKVEKVVVGVVERRKTPFLKRMQASFFGGDARGVVGYILVDVLLPAAKDAVADAVSQGIEKMLFGEVRSVGRRTGYRPGESRPGYTSYSRPSSGTRPEPRTQPRPEPRRDMSPRARGQFDFDEIVLATRAEAEEVISRMYDLVTRYEQVTVSDLYSLLGMDSSFTDEKWGWTDIRGASAVRVRNGYLLDLPKPEQLD